MTDLTGSFVLPADAVLQPIDELPDAFVRQLGSQGGDVVLSRSNSRRYSKVIDSDAADLVEEFRTESTIARAVARFSKSKSVDAERLLEEALPMLQSLIEAGLLAPADSKEAAPTQPSLTLASSLDGWDILRCVQALEDTDVYLACGPAGQLGALKLSHSGSAARAIEREASILAKLDSPGIPRLLKAGEWKSQPYLITQWFAGAEAQMVCAEFHQSPDWESRRALHRIAGAILQAYAALHEQGIVHGDVHPRNVLIDRRQTVKIIDLGLAEIGAQTQWSAARLVGVSFFFEPEFARAVRNGVPPPPRTFLGEQYSLAALLYVLLTGAHYLDFILEKDAMLEQIAQAPMVAFAVRGTAPWPGVERLLKKALSKAPEDRFASLADFSQAWDAADIPRPVAGAGRADDSKLLAIRREILAATAIGGSLLRDGPMPAPATSMNYGSAGVACALYRIACATDDGELLALSDVWSTRAVGELGSPGAFLDEALGITAARVGSLSLYHGPSGVYVLQALIAHARGDAGLRSAAARNFIETCRQPCDVMDLTLGRAGALLGCTLLLEAVDEDELRATGNDLCDRLWQTLEGCAPIGESRDPGLGMAHGWPGLLYATICWYAAAGQVLPDSVHRRLRELAQCAQPVHRGLQWVPESARRIASPYLSGWCDGSAGYVFLWTKAHSATGLEAYLELAEGAAWSVWEMPHPNPSLCCGMAGQAYALLNFHRASADSAWLRRAERIADAAAVAFAQRRSAGGVEPPDDRLASLYKGEAGIAVLSADLERPDEARMPMFECER
jgi:serine/threonine-protein kinase